MLICVVSINSIEDLRRRKAGRVAGFGRSFLVQALGSLNSIFQANLAMQYNSFQLRIARCGYKLDPAIHRPRPSLLPFLATPLLSGLVYVLLIAAIAIKRFQLRGLGCNLFTYVVSENPDRAGQRAGDRFLSG